jgi:hypothetical protein
MDEHDAGECGEIFGGDHARDQAHDAERREAVFGSLHAQH